MASDGYKGLSEEKKKYLRKIGTGKYLKKTKKIKDYGKEYRKYMPEEDMKQFLKV